METIRGFMQARGGSIEVDGKPVTLRLTGASLQVYLGDEPYPESRMRTENNRTILLAADGKPGAQMLVEGQRVVLLRADGADPLRGVAVRDGWGQPVVMPGEGRLLIGVSLSPLNPTLAQHLKLDSEKASVILSVTEGWPAADAGLASGDVIISVEGSDDGTSEALRRAIGEREAGDSIRLGVVSGGERKDVTVTLSDKAREHSFAPGQLGSPAASMFYQQQGAQGTAAAGQYAAVAAQERVQAAQSELNARLAAVASRQGAAGRRSEASTGQSRELIVTRAPDAARQPGAQGQAAGQWVVPEQLWSARSENDAQVFVRIPSGGVGGRALVSSAGESDLSRRLGMIEERIAQMEEMLRKLSEQSGGR